MREVFDAIDSMDPWALLAALAFVFVILTEIQRRIEERDHREREACARIAGYAHGYRAGARGEMPAYRAAEETGVPAAFTREKYS